MLVAPTARWSSWFHLMITLLEKKYLQQSRVYRNLASFQEWPLAPFILSSRVNSSFSLILDSPLHILKTSMRSCLFLLSSSVHNFKHCNLSSYVFPSMLLIIFVNLWTEVLRPSRLSVCLSVCSARVSQKRYVQTCRNFLYMLPVAVARSSCDNSAICYVLPDGVLAQIQIPWHWRIIHRDLARWRRGRSLLSLSALLMMTYSNFCYGKRNLKPVSISQGYIVTPFCLIMACFSRYSVVVSARVWLLLAI